MGSDLDYSGHRIHLVGSRVLDLEHHVHETAHQHHHGHGHGHGHGDGHQQLADPDNVDRPVFKKNHAATNFELFYDLWFVANLSVFGGIHDISNEKALVSFIGYIALLWTTWAVTTLFDVRYTADSVLERCCRAVHLGAMVGFAEIGTSFNPNNQIKSVFRAMSFCLAASRLVLALQYTVVAFQVRKYVEGWRPLALTAFLHLAASAVYFGISFRYDDNKNSRVYVVWYIIGVAELILHLVFSQLTEVLSFVGSHLGERLNLLTLIIIGEGAILLAKNVTLLVKDTYLKDTSLAIWSPALIGTVTAAAALIYLVFQLYFDWLHEGDGMSDRHQVWWTTMHLPFHASLVLMLEGSNQFVIWTRLQESVATALDSLFSAFKSDDIESSEDAAKALYKTTMKYLTKYPPSDLIDTYQHVNETIADIADVPDSAWTGEGNIAPEWVERLADDTQEIAYVIINAIYVAFGIEEEAEKDDEVALGRNDNDEPYMATAANESIRNRFLLVLIYTFACSGIVLLLLTIMHAISKRRGWTPFNVARTILCMILSIGLSLVALIATKKDQNGERTTVNNFIDSSMMLPTITLTFFAALVITHLPHPRWGVGKYKDVDYSTVEGGGKRHGPHVLRQLHLSTRRGRGNPGSTHSRHVSMHKSRASMDSGGGVLHDRSGTGMRHRPHHVSHMSTASAGAGLMSPEYDEFAGPDPRRASNMSAISINDMDPLRSPPIMSYDQSEQHQVMTEQPYSQQPYGQPPYHQHGRRDTGPDTRYDPGVY